MVNGAVAAITAAGVPYLRILGSEPSPDTAAWFTGAAPHAAVEVWADSGTSRTSRTQRGSPSD